MQLWDRFKDFVERAGNGAMHAGNLREEDLRLAAAALLIHAGGIDGEFDAVERKKLEALLQARFDLDGSELRRLLGEAEAEEHQAVDLYRFTSVLCRELDQEGRQRLVEMLWEIVLADGVLHEFESNLVWRASELLGVSTHDRMRLRKLVESRSG
jgi:uncharacterized tellurite resistance protein B-like protein